MLCGDRKEKWRFHGGEDALIPIRSGFILARSINGRLHRLQRFEPACAMPPPEGKLAIQ
jgi:hypothetical protein